MRAVLCVFAEGYVLHAASVLRAVCCAMCAARRWVLRALHHVLECYEMCDECCMICAVHLCTVYFVLRATCCVLRAVRCECWVLGVIACCALRAKSYVLPGSCYVLCDVHLCTSCCVLRAAG